MSQKINLICLPFAGGSSYSYNALQQHLPAHISFIPVDPPGHGRRSREPLLEDARSAAADIYRHVREHCREPYAIFGHSMGSLLAWLLVKEIAAAGGTMPCHLFFSGSAAPSMPVKQVCHNLPGDSFFEEVIRLGGCPEEMKYSRHLREFAEPILRADFKLVETFSYTPDTPFNIPTDVFAGTADDLTEEELAAWQYETTEPVCRTMFGGDHFFLMADPAATAAAIISKLNKYYYHELRKCISEA